jgi:hypothetical protein
MVPAYWLYPQDLIIPLKLALVVNSIFDTLTLLLILKIILNLTQSKFSLIFASIAWIFNSYIISTTLNSLETMISTFFLILMIYYSYKISLLDGIKIKPLKLFLFGLIGGIATFARIDNAILLFIIYLALAFYLIFKHKDFSQFIKSTLIIFAGFLIAYLPWIIYSYTYTGLIYPISGKAVRFQTTYHVLNLNSNIGYYLGIFKQSFKVVLSNNLSLCATLLASLFIITFQRKLKETINSIFKNKEIFLLMVFCLTLITAYTIYVPATWFFSRYYFPFASTLVLLTAIVIRNLKILTSRSFVFKIYIIFFLIELIGFNNRGILYENKKNSNGYIEIGQWANTVFPDGTIIGSSQTGAFGYFAENLKVINLDGVVNEECYKSLVNKTNMDYIRSQKIQYILGWDINLKFIRDNSINYKDNDLVKIGAVPKITSWGNYWNIYKVNYENN